MKLNEYLKLSGLSQGDFGKKVGASQGMVSHVITGRASLTTRNVLLWCEATGWEVTPHDMDVIAYPNPTDALPAEFSIQSSHKGEVNHENQA
ncbi:TPA: helix-turn-helix domain-containing protein [Raoultella ornithinolytica]